MPADRGTMDALLLDGLPPLSRLALSYAPASARTDWLTLLALDARLASVLQQARDPVLAQIRLAWWRERLAQPTAERPQGEPLLARLGDWHEGGAGLAVLVDGWEALLAESELQEEAMNLFVEGRKGAIAMLCARQGLDAAGAGSTASRWALADLACHFAQSSEQAIAAALHAGIAPKPLRNRILRPLLVLERVTSRGIGRGGAKALTSPLALFTAMRAGLLGR